MSITDDARETTRRYVGERPLLCRGFYALRPRHRSLLVEQNTDLLIEGFPRSGNTFAVVAFEQAQKERVRVAHHLHMPAQVMLAQRWRIPALILIREPTDAVLSWAVRDPRISIRQAFKHYVSFYANIATRRQAFAAGLFEEVIQDYGAVVERVNAKFGTGFSAFDHSEENVREVFARIEERHRDRRGSVLDEKQISRPSAAKNEMKDALMKDMKTPEVKKLAARAGTVYEDFVRQIEETP